MQGVEIRLVLEPLQHRERSRLARLLDPRVVLAVPEHAVPHTRRVRRAPVDVVQTQPHIVTAVLHAPVGVRTVRRVDAVEDPHHFERARVAVGKVQFDVVLVPIVVYAVPRHRVGEHGRIRLRFLLVVEAVEAALVFARQIVGGAVPIRVSSALITPATHITSNSINTSAATVFTFGAPPGGFSG